jgi:hypothetical protein
LLVVQAVEVVFAAVFAEIELEEDIAVVQVAVLVRVVQAGMKVSVGISKAK